MATGGRSFKGTSKLFQRLLGFTPRGVHHIWEAERLGVGITNTEAMEFPGMSLDEAFKAFTRAAYGHPLELEHA